MIRKYTKKELIDDFHRFVRENGRNPIQSEMSPKYGYPSSGSYAYYFGSFNNALNIANLPLNRTHDKGTGFETCCICGNYKKENQQWHTKGLLKGQVMCANCYLKSKSDYINGSLDPDSEVGKGFISQRVVAKTLGLELKDDCNCTYGFNHSVDLYHKDKYKYINVKDSALCYHQKQSPTWHFTITQKVTPDTYILVGFDEDRKNILHVWITDAVDDLVFNEKKGRSLKFKTISNIYESLKRAKPWEVDAKPYNNVLHSMSLDNCSVLRKD